LLSEGVTRFGMVLVSALLAIGAGCRGPSPRDDLYRDGAADAARLERVERMGRRLLADGRIDWGVSPRDGQGAWAWPDGRVQVSRALVDGLDDDELSAALAHELGHLLDRGHLPRGPRALRGAPGSDDLESRADRLGCDLLARGGVPPDAMARMLFKVAAALGGDGDVARRAAAAGATCHRVPGGR
jgi:Zn-dependent protease with chaperone function